MMKMAENQVIVGLIFFWIHNAISVTSHWSLHMKSPIEYLYWRLQWKTSIDINIYSKCFLILNHHNEVSYWILLLKTPAEDFSVNCHLKDDFNYNRLCSTIKRTESIIDTHVLLRDKDSFQNKTVCGVQNSTYSTRHQGQSILCE